MDRERWLTAFRISATVLIASLIGAVLPLPREVGPYLWIGAALSGFLCLVAAWRLRDSERALSATDGIWLGDATSSTISSSDSGGCESGGSDSGGCDGGGAD